MSAREWKPGDVAMVSWTYDGRGETEPAVRRSKGWDALDDATGFLADIDVYKVRPLVVIDPENREQVERLLADYYTRLNPRMERVAAEPSLVGDMQAALREFANPKPPKPEEPTGLGAVVEDEQGMTWFRWHSPGYDELHPAQDRPWSARNGMGSDRRYDELTVVRILSEGVQP